MNKTSIAWTDYTWNPIRGCLAVSPGCDSCYAAEVAARFGDTPQFEGFAKRAPSGRAYFTGKTAFLPKKLNEPLGATGGIRVFVGSMADLFHKDYSDDEIDQVFDVMERRPDITFQLLTKRPERMRDYVTHRMEQLGLERRYGRAPLLESLIEPWPTLPAHIWCGTSVEDQKRADERIPILLATPAAVRFLSVEPMLGPVDLAAASPCGYYCEVNPEEFWPEGHNDHDFLTPGRKPGIHWVIAGGESGRFRRPMDDAWVRALQQQCAHAGVAFFFKQGGALKSGQRPYLDGWKWEQFPGDLRPPEPYGSCPGEDITKAFPMEATIAV